MTKEEDVYTAQAKALIDGGHYARVADLLAQEAIYDRMREAYMAHIQRELAERAQRVCPVCIDNCECWRGEPCQPK